MTPDHPVEPARRDGICRRAARAAAYRVVVSVLLLVRPLFRVDIRGLEHIAPTGPCIVAANHISMFDPLPIALLVHRAGRKPRFLITEEVFAVPVVGRLLRTIGQIPVRRVGGDALGAFEAAVVALAAGECVVLYPEAAVTTDPAGWPMRPKRGVARLALLTGAPIVPVGQWGAQDVLTRSGRPRLTWRRRRIVLRAGPAIALGPPGRAGEPASPSLLADLADQVIDVVTALVADARGETAPVALVPTDRT